MTNSSVPSPEQFPPGQFKPTQPPLTVWEKWGIEGQSDYDPFDPSQWESEIASRRERAQGTIIGLAVGAALEATVEGERSAEIYGRYGEQGQTELRGRGGPHHLAVDAYTGNIAMMGCLMDSLLATNQGVAKTEKMQLNIYDLGQRLVRWLDTPHPPTIDATLETALLKLRQGVSPLHSGEADPLNQTNGAVTRCAPVAVLFSNPNYFSQLARASLLSAYPTHRAAVSTQGCILVNLIVAQLIHYGNGFNRAYLAAKALLQSSPWQTHLGQWEADGCPGTGHDDWVVSSVLTAFHCVLTTSSFEQAVLKAVNGGQAASMAGALTGAIAGARYGESAISAQWTKALQDYARMHHQAEALFELGRRY